MPEQMLTPPVNAIELSTVKFMTDTTSLLVDHPDQVIVETRIDGNSVILKMSVAPEDIGKVIGKHGRTARSLRVLLNAISNKTGIHFALDIQAERN